MKIFLALYLFISCNCYAQIANLTTGEFPPFAGKNLEHGGLAAEIVTLIFDEMGYHTQLSFRPWKRGLSETFAGKYLGTFPYSKNKEREKTLYFSEKLYELEEHFFILKNNPIHYDTQNDLAQMKICKPLGYNLFGLKKLAENKVITLSRPKNMELCFKMLRSNHVDMVMTNEITARKYIEKLFVLNSDVIMMHKSFVKIGHHFVIPKSNQQGKEIIAQFNNILIRLKESGDIGLITSRHIN